MSFGVFVQVNEGSRYARYRPIGYVIQESGCWDWVGSLDHDGYGKMNGNGHTLAHRVLYEQHRGPIPAGMETDHLCRNRKCVNPDHLEVVTPLENWRRGQSMTALNGRKTQCQNGHDFTPENTCLTTEGRRRCRTCDSAYHRARHLLRPPRKR